MFTAKVKTATSTKKASHQVHSISGTDCSEYAELKNIIENATGKLKMIEGKLKQQVKEIFIDEYNRTGKCPDNFKVQDDEGKNLLGIVMDKYISVSAEKYELIKSTELVEEKRTFTFNTELLEKYQETIENLLMGCPDISDKDKENLIEGVITYSIKKGAINELSGKNKPVGELFEVIQPIIQLKVSN
jgi:hypothetical protein